MKEILTLGILGLFITCIISQSTNENLPEQIHINYGKNTNEVIITWQQNTNNSGLYFGTTPDLLHTYIKSEPKTFSDDGKYRTIHSARLPLLNKGCLSSTKKKFYYKIDNSEIKNFRLRNYIPKIAVYGDLGYYNSKILPSLKNKVINDEYDYIIHLGDLAYDLNYNRGDIGDLFMRDIESISSAIPYMACLGNHEKEDNFTDWTNRFKGMGSTDTGNNWWFTWTDNYNNTNIQYFAISTEVYYHTQYGKQIEDQYYWLEKALKNSKADWKIVIGHRPLYCSSLDYPRCTDDASKIRDGITGDWQGYKYGFEYLFHTYKVDMYFCGHIHSYERTFPLYKGNYQIFNNNTYTNPNSTVYIISGAAGNREMLNDFYDDHIYGKWSAYRSSTYGYGDLIIYNKTHLYWSQMINLSKSDPDTLWIVKNKVDTKIDNVI